MSTTPPAKPGELLDGCDIVYMINKTIPPAVQYVIGYVSGTQTSDQRNISRRSEIGSNATFLLVDEGQKSMTIQRLNTARAGVGLPHGGNLLAYIKWVLTDGASSAKIIIDLDDAAFSQPFDLEKIMYTAQRESTGSESGMMPVSKVTYKRCKIAQYNMGLGAAAKYSDDTIAITWEETINENLGTDTGTGTGTGTN